MNTLSRYIIVFGYCVFLICLLLIVIKLFRKKKIKGTLIVCIVSLAVAVACTVLFLPFNYVVTDSIGISSSYNSLDYSEKLQKKNTIWATNLKTLFECTKEMESSKEFPEIGPATYEELFSQVILYENKCSKDKDIFSDFKNIVEQSYKIYIDTLDFKFDEYINAEISGGSVPDIDDGFSRDRRLRNSGLGEHFVQVRNIGAYLLRLSKLDSDYTELITNSKNYYDSFTQKWCDSFDRAYESDNEYACYLINDGILETISKKECFIRESRFSTSFVSEESLLDDELIARCDKCKAEHEELSGYYGAVKDYEQGYWLTVTTDCKEYIEKFSEGKHIDEINALNTAATIKYEEENEAKKSQGGQRPPENGTSGQKPDTVVYSSKELSDKNERSIVWAAAEASVKSQLVNPKSAKFPSSSANKDVYINVTETNQGRFYTVEAWVEASNALGGTLRQNFVASFEHVSGSGSSLKIKDNGCVIY